MNEQNDRLVTSVWGKITRREMLRRLAMSGLAIGLGENLLSSRFSISAQEKAKQDKTLSETEGKIHSPYKDVDGQPFRKFTPPKPERSLAELFKKATKEDARDGKPSARRRDSFWYSKPDNARGTAIYQYTQSANHPSNSCAQAACATLLHKYGKIPAGLSGDAVTDKIYETHPPETAGGTTAARLVDAIRYYGLNCWRGSGADYGFEQIRSTLRTWVAAGYPCIVLLDMRYPTGLTNQGYFGHYVVVFAYDESETNGYVYMSNWDYKNWFNDWGTFKQAWSLKDYPAHAYPLVVGWR